MTDAQPMTVQVRTAFGETTVSLSARADPRHRSVVVVASSAIMNASSPVTPDRARAYAALLNEAADLAEKGP